MKLSLVKDVSLKDINAEIITEDQEKEYHTGKCAFCGKETAIDQFGFCATCGERMVRLDNIPLLTIVPIPYIKIGKIKEAIKESVWTFKEGMSREDD